jgi:hypothetical protein
MGSWQLRRKTFNLAVLAVGVLLIKALWFSASAVVPQLAEVWGLTASQRAWLTMSVQLGFVAGALVSAFLNLADRFDLTRILVAGALLVGMLFNQGPYLAGRAPFDWRHALDALRHRPTRLANFGYLGHMWELYAMWA